MDVNRPVAVIDTERCRNNIQYMSGKAEQLGLLYRPHFKTHQSAEVGSWYRDAGVTAATVSSAGMASYFLKEGWNDITIAFPATPAQFSDIQNIANTAELNIFLNDPESARYFSGNLTNNLGVFIEIDAGFGRSGIPANNLEQIEAIRTIISHSDHLHFHGFYVHDGRTYQATGKKEVGSIIEPVLSSLKNLKEEFPDAVACLGDTPSCSLQDTFPGLDEVSPGNNIFYDLMQLKIGSCRQEDIAIAVVCPVAQVNAERSEAIIHGGAVHLSKESLEWEGKSVYGVCIELDKEGFGDIIDGCYLKSLSQEHGTITGNPDWVSSLKAGDSVCILPVHSCLTANLFDHYESLDGKRIKKRILS